MKQIYKLSLLSVFLLILSNINTYSQYSHIFEDAVDLATPNGYPNARSLSLGTSYYGFLGDIASIHYNPAGILSMRDEGEMSLGLTFRNNKATTEHLNSTTSYNSNSFGFNNFGLCFGGKLDTGKTRRVGFGIFIYRANNFNKGHSLNWFNPNSSIVQHLANIGPEILYRLGLSSESDKSLSPINGNMQQTASVIQEGSLYNFSFGGAYEIISDLYIGVSIIGAMGDQYYKRNYTEKDINNAYNSFDGENFTNINISSIEVNEYVYKDKDILSHSGNIGVLWEIGEFTRLSASIKLHTSKDITFDYLLDVHSNFDNNASTKVIDLINRQLSYDLYIPPTYSFGFSFNTLGIDFATGVSYTNYSNISIKNYKRTTNYGYDNDLYTYTDIESKQNILFKSELKGGLDWGIGAEYKIPDYPLTFRASYSSKSSPYKHDATTKNIVGVGASMGLGSGFRIDLGMQYAKFNQYMMLYAGDIESRYKINNNNINFGLNIVYCIK